MDRRLAQGWSTRRLLSRSTFFLVVIFTVACSSGPDPDDEQQSTNDRDSNSDAESTEQGRILEEALDFTRPPYTLEAEKNFYRLDLRQSTDGELSLSNIWTTSLSVRPLPRLQAQYLVATYSASGEVLSATVAGFPETLRSSRLEGKALLHAFTALEESQSTVFLEASEDAARIQVFDQEGESKLEISLDSPVQEWFSDRDLQSTRKPPSVTTKRQVMDLEELSYLYPHILFLKKGDENLILDAVLEGGALISPTESHYNIIAEGLSKIAPGPLSAVSTFALASWPATDKKHEDTMAQALDSTIVVNLKYINDSEMPITLVHESTHNFTFLTDGTQLKNSNLPDEWPKDARNLAVDLLSQFQLTVGVEDVWNSIHQTGVELGTALDYVGENYKTLSNGDAIEGSLASAYGGHSTGEDIAEFAAYAHTPKSGYCQALSSASELSALNAIVFGKLVLLRGIGVISSEVFKSCVGKIGLPTEPGIIFPQKLSFQDDLVAGTLDDGNNHHSFAVIGSESSTYQVMIEVALPKEGHSPLGLHRLDYLSAQTIGASGTNSITLAHEEPLRARYSVHGLVLFTDARPDLTAGAFFSLVLQSPAGVNTDFIPFGSFYLP